MQEWDERDVASEGVWHYLADGTCLWRLSIVSQGAASQILIFRCDQCTLTTPETLRVQIAVHTQNWLWNSSADRHQRNIMQLNLPPPPTSLQHEVTPCLMSAVSWVCRGAAR